MDVEAESKPPEEGTVPTQEEEEEEEEEDEEDVKRKEEEQRRAVELGEEAVAKARNKRDFKLFNLKAAEHRPDKDSLKRLDGSVKKNSAFVKKLRTLTEQQRASLSSDFEGLNLSKYIQEAATSVAESRIKVADVGCAVHICSLLHRRYADFSPLLLEQLQKVYSGKIGKDDTPQSVVTTKYRLGVRLLGELVLGGIVDEDIGIQLLLDVITEVTRADLASHPYLTVVLNFARHCGEDVAGILPRKQRMLLTQYGIQPPTSELLPVEKQQEFRGILHSYFASLKKHLLHEHKEMHKREKRNRQILQSKGELSDERKMDNEAFQKAYDKLLTNTSTLADILDLDMPDLPEEQLPQEESDISIELQFPTMMADVLDDPHSVWEDEDARSFYEGITDIKPFVPAILYEGKKRSTSESSDPSSTAANDEGEPPTDASEEMDEEKVLQQVIQDTEQITLDEEEGVAPGDEGEEEKGKGEGVEPGSAAALLDEFIGRLPRLMNRKFVDEFAVEFCMSMNTKINRRRLARALFNVDRNRMDLIPFYARLACTLHQCLDDIAPTLLDMLVRDFRFQVRKKDQIHIHSKLKNVRFIAELTKFGVCPKADTMKCITILLHDFTHHNLEMACMFVEHCGRYLLRSPDSHLRAKALLEIMVRKKRIQHLDGRQKSLVENALYYANPPETPQIVHETRPPMLEYIWKLLYKDLNKLNTEKVLRQFRKLNWNDPEVMQYAVTSLTRIWNVKFNNIHCVANLLAGLKPYQEDATIRVVDGVLEDIRLGLELNWPKMNQRRVSGVKFLGELYSYQLVESNVIFRTLYLLIQFGCNADGTPSPVDPYDSYFRVRLVCILMDTCGQYFDRGSSKKKLDAFLVFFQCYLFSKRQPLPLEVDHMVTDTIEALRPELTLFTTAQEAYEAALELERKFRDKMGHSDQLEGDSDEEGEEEERGGVREDEGEEAEEDDDEPMEGLSQPDQSDDEPEPVLRTAPKLISCQEDDDFVSAFDKMMADDIQSRRAEKVRVEIALPMHLKGGGGGKKTNADPLIHEDGVLKMKFKVMTKKGHKQQLKELNIPIDSGLATSLRDTREALKEEHQEMKKLVLASERRQEEEAYKAMVAAEQLQLKLAKKHKAPQPLSFGQPFSQGRQQPSFHQQQAGKHPPYQQTGKQAAHQQPGKQAAHQQQTGKQAPYQQTGKQAPHQQTGKQAPYQQPGKQAPHQQTGKQAPHQQQRGQRSKQQHRQRHSDQQEDGSY